MKEAWGSRENAEWDLGFQRVAVTNTPMRSLAGELQSGAIVPLLTRAHQKDINELERSQ